MDSDMDNAENWMSPNEENFIDCNDPDAPEKTMEMDEIQNPREHLKEITDQLTLSESKFQADKEVLNYMKALYLNVQSDKNESSDMSEKAKSDTSSRPESPDLKNLNDNAYMSKFLKSNNVEEPCKTERSKTSRSFKEEIEIQNLASPMKLMVSPRIQVIQSEKSNESADKLMGKSFLSARQNKMSSNSFSNAAKSASFDKFEKMDFQDPTAYMHSFPRHIAEYSMNAIIQNNDIIEDCEQSFRQQFYPFTKSGQEETVLKVESISSIRTTSKHKKSKKKKPSSVQSASRTVRKLSSSKVDENVGISAKNKRKRNRVKSNPSKSTIPTAACKEPIWSEKKEYKRRKKRVISARGSVCCEQPAQSFPDTPRPDPNNLSEVYEIYHNAAVDSSLSAVSNKLYDSSYTKNCKGEPDTKETSVKQIFVKEKGDEPDNNNVKTHSFLQHTERHDRLKFKRDVRLGQVIKEVESEKEDQCENLTQPNYDPLVQRNYEMPTVASTMKKVNKSYYNKFNFRNIPFVVGTSISPSHNLCFNIQQVLSIMKAKHNVKTKIAPLYIRKIGGNDNPITILMDKMNKNCGQIQEQMSSYEMPERNNDCVVNKVFDYGETRKSRMDMQSLYNGVKPMSSHRNLEQVDSIKKTLSKNKWGGVHSKVSTFLVETDNDEKKNDFDNLQFQESSISLKNYSEIKKVFSSLYTQFNDMNSKYEKLQEKFQKTKDKHLEKEMQALDKEVSLKEAEINAFVSLYKEVIELKKEMRRLNNRTSAICIKTRSNMFADVSQYRISGNRRKVELQRAHEPSTSLQLIGLLRQIQMFQKQLKQS